MSLFLQAIPTFPVLALLVTVVVAVVGHIAILVARRAHDLEMRRLAGHMTLATLLVVGTVTLLTAIRPDGNWLLPAVAMCSLAIGVTFEAGDPQEDTLF